MTESLKELGERALTYPQVASQVIVYDAESLKAANDFLLAIKKMLKEIRDAFGPIVEQAHKAHKEALNQKKKYDEPLLKAEKAVKLQIGVYVRKLEDERREAQRKADEAEAKRLQKQAEIEAEAQRFENHGHHREAEEIREQYVETKAVDVPDAPSLNGVSVSKILAFEVTDESLLPRLFLSVDKVKIRTYIREHKEKAIELTIPGLRIYYEDSVRASKGE